VKKKKGNVPVFLIYAGIIHAIGLALLMPMLITLPGPGGGIAPRPASVDVEIAPASPSVAQVEQDTEQTSALPSASPSATESPVDAPNAVANVSPQAQPEDEQGSTAQEPSAAESPAKEKSKAQGARAARHALGAAKKSVAQRSKTAKPVIRHTARTQSKITSFNGALSGLFSPGAPANRPR